MTTIGSILESLVSNITRDSYPPDPPDVFALMGTVLRVSGTYIAGGLDFTEDRYGVVNLAHTWRVALNRRRRAPAGVLELWKTVIDGCDRTLNTLTIADPVRTALIRLFCTADEACALVGTPRHVDAYAGTCYDCLHSNGTLCGLVPIEKAVVVPKLHAPQAGANLRCLSHHIALVTANEVRLHWRTVPHIARRRECLTLLLVPWPMLICPSQFRETCVHRRSDGSGVGFFAYNLGDSKSADLDPAKLHRLVENANATVGPIDGVIFPELALSSRQFELAEGVVGDAFVLSGVAEPQRNTLRWSVPHGSLRTASSTDKHHRWRIDRSQVTQYGLGASLHPQFDWWESILLERRQIDFFALDQRLVVCGLLCEDLAQQDPVMEVVRGVGPTLVVALLLDGPQLANRWSARYASTLADDPGTSILTLTSLGMTTLSRPAGMGRSRTIALWKDSQTGTPVQIDLPEGADGVVLSLASERKSEWTLDGRKRDVQRLILCGQHEVTDC